MSLIVLGVRLNHLDIRVIEESLNLVLIESGKVALLGEVLPEHVRMDSSSQLLRKLPKLPSNGFVSQGNARMFPE
ncbi:hypothetical protein SCOR_27360 [Sulfidibacter corallicola]